MTIPNTPTIPRMVLEIIPRKRFVNFESVSLDGMENGKKGKMMMHILTIRGYRYCLT